MNRSAIPPKLFLLHRLLFMLAISGYFSCSEPPRVEKNFFNGKDLSGWSSPSMQFWSVEDSAIVGSAKHDIEKNEFLWSDIEVKDFYLSLDVKLDSADRNAGIQFRSKKADDQGQAFGYQADIGLNRGEKIWGTLYHEHGRGLLNASEKGKDIVKDGEWNHYEILAVGHKIWIAINDSIISATEDPGGELQGFIALQIHAGPPQTVRYRIRELVHNPKIKLAGKTEDALDALLKKPLVFAEGHEALKLRSGDIIAFAGGTNISNMQFDGYLETLLTSYFPDAELKFRNVAWEGDQVYEQFRDVGFGSWSENIDSLEATKVFVQFGQMEALAGAEAIPLFVEKYRELLRSISKKGREIIILSPIAFEQALLKVHDQPHWNNTLARSDIERYLTAIQKLAQEENYTYVDLYWPLINDDTFITSNGIHLNEEGQRQTAEMIMKRLGLIKTYNEKLEPLRQQIVYKNRIWYSYWRPGNWAFLKGDRMGPAFSRDWRDPSHRIFPEEMKMYEPLLKEAEELISKSKEDPDSVEKPVARKKNITDITAKTSADTDKSVAEEIASFELDKDYNIELFASEALGIAEPSAMRWDEKGRLWVLCIPTYPHPLPGQPADDKLVVLEDTDKDGRADKSTIFADNLDIPLGFELGHNGVYLGEQTRLQFLSDTNNDLRADVKKTLLSGFGTHDSHQTINSFNWSPGGELYFAQGLSIHSFIETPWGVRKAHRGAIWRYRPFSGELEEIADQSTVGDNPWGMTFGDWGETFSKSNNTEVFYTSPSLVVTDHNVYLPVVGSTVIKSGIVEIPRTEHLPEDIRNDFLIAGYYNNTIERIKVKESGAGYDGELSKPLLVSKSTNFRPVDIRIGPDGAIYVLDWYNPIIGHYQASMRDPQRDKVHGRVWRITAKNRPPAKIPELVNQPVSSLLDALKSKEYFVRYQARRLLAARPVKEVLPATEKWIKELKANNSDYEHHLMEALAVYETFETVNEPLLKKLLRAKQSGARAYAAQVTGRWASRLQQPLELIAPLVTDHHPRVRMMAVVAASYVHQADAMTLVTKVLDRPMDRFIKHAFEKTVFALRESWEPAFREKRTNFKNNKHLAAVIGTLKPSWFTGAMYRDLLNTGEYEDELKIEILKALASTGDSKDLEHVLSLPFTQKTPKLIYELGNKEAGKLSAGSVLSVKNMLSSPSEEVVAASVKLVKHWKILDLVTDIKEVVTKSGQSEEIIAEGIYTILDLKGREALPVVDIISKEDHSRRVRKACVDVYARFNVSKGAAETVSEIKRNGKDVNELADFISPVLYAPNGISLITSEINKRGLNESEAAAALAALAQREVVDVALLKTVRKYAPSNLNNIPRDFNQEFVARMTAKIKNSGDASRGERIYWNKLTCRACHAIGDKGGNTGPNLSAIGSGLAVGDIITEVLWPNKNVKEGYFSVKLEMKNGESIQGIKVVETATEISIKNAPSAAPASYSKKDISRIVPVGSAMPEGLVTALSEQELADMLKYLAAQKN